MTRTWNFMDFSSCDAILQARGVFFVLFIYRECPGLRTRKSIRNTKTSLFWKLCFFSIHLRENTPLRDFLNLWKKRFSGSRVLKFGKIHDRFSFLDWGIILGGRLFSAIWGGNVRRGRKILRIWNAEFPLQNCILASQILKNFRLRRVISTFVFLYKI